MTKESFTERLRRLRHDAPKPPVQPAQKKAPEWLRERLERRNQASKSRRIVSDPIPVHVAKLALPSGLVSRTGSRGAFSELIVCRSVSDRHGDFRFEEVDHASDLATLCQDQTLEGFNPRTCVYLDIETTGLSGGAGTWPFMVALGSFSGDKFELWQGFMREPGEEPGVLEETARRIRASSGVVSFFGKSFDRHRLEDKMRIHDIESPFEGRPHLDLYHPLNRLYTQRAVWDRHADGACTPKDAGLLDGKLGTMERGLLGFERKHDLSGAHAPLAWFDFLAQRPHLLNQVFRHNALDVWSLVGLLAHLGRTLQGQRRDGLELSGPKLARTLGLASLARGRLDRKAEVIHLSAARRLLEQHSWPASLALWLADARRLSGDYDAALLDYVVLEADGAATSLHRAVSACERAKVLEHHKRDFEAALAACESARQAAVGGRVGGRFLEELDRRAKRLVHKLNALRSVD